MQSSKNGTADHTVLDHMTDAELTQLVIDLGGMFCEVKTDPTFFRLAEMASRRSAAVTSMLLIALASTITTLVSFRMLFSISS